jgi:tRNA pseudouridine55 synthase
VDGYLLVDKPTGISSFGVVARARRFLSEEAARKVKVGHTGTLDPFATGLMILVVGSYTKRAAEFSKLDKVYEAELQLGSVSTTGDPEGEITKVSVKQPAQAEVEAVLRQFVGEIEQTPPAFSAIKVGGQRAYKLARAGKTVEIKPRQVMIYSIENVEYAYPKLAFMVRVGSGTYIRSLAQDIGKALGTGAYLSVLRRTRVGKLDIEDSLKVDDLSASNIENHLQK